MKHLITLIIGSFLIQATMAQNGNGGQASENSYVKLSYLGYSGGYYMIECTNKQGCGIDHQFNWAGKDSTIYITGTQLLYLKGPALPMQKIKAKPLNRCHQSGGNMGWVEVETPLSLPVKFTGVWANALSISEWRIDFEVSEAQNVNRFEVQVSTDGINYKTKAILFPDEVNPNRKYSVKLKLLNKQ